MLNIGAICLGKNVRRPMAQAGADFVLGGGQMTGSMIGVGRETKNRTKVLGAQDQFAEVSGLFS
jgi:hypothetical protein